MLKQTVRYTDFNNETVTEDLYFNIAKTELVENLSLKEELEDIQKMLLGTKRTLTTEEVLKILDMVKMFMRLSYGVRSEDGTRFAKRDHEGRLYFDAFKETAAYDAFLWSLFENPEKAMSFLTDVMPRELIAQAEKDLPADVRARLAEMQREQEAPEPAPKKPSEMTVDELREALEKKVSEGGGR